MRTIGSRSIALVVGLLAVVGCDDDHVLLAVDLRTDIVPVDEFDRVLVTLEGGGLEVSEAADEAFDYTEGRRIAELEVPRGVVHFEVALTAADGVVVASRPVTVTIDAALGMTIVITRDCVGVACPGAADPASATACVGQRCVSPACSEENPAACGAPECVVAADCPGGASCASPRCEGGTCLLIANHSSCAIDERCIPESGCRTRGGLMDAGVDAAPDTAVADTNPADTEPDAGGIAAGFWSGGFMSDIDGGWTATYTQSGSVVTGTGTSTGSSACLANHTFSGTITGARLTGTNTSTADPSEVSVVTADIVGDTISGSYDISGGACDGISGTYMGMRGAPP